MDLEQKLEGPLAWWFAGLMCLLIVGAMYVGAYFNRPPVAPAEAAASSDIAVTGGAPTPSAGR